MIQGPVIKNGEMRSNHSWLNSTFCSEFHQEVLLILKSTQFLCKQNIFSYRNVNALPWVKNVLEAQLKMTA